MKGAIAIVCATALWLPCLHLCYGGPDRAALYRRQLALVDNGIEDAIAPARDANPEWDLMGRTFVAWGLANHALREPAEAPRALAAIDKILGSILAREKSGGFRAFLLPYGRGRFEEEPEASLFVDSEIALTAALRRLVRDDDPRIRELSRSRADRIAERIRRFGLVESYPDEGWTFDHAVAAAALHAIDKLDGSDHSVAIRAIVAALEGPLLDARTRLPVSSFTMRGRTLDGPEGSTLWMTLHCLQLVDEPFARAAFERARRALVRSLWGFAWAREWPDGERGSSDVDSGPVIPVVDVSAGSSGLLFVAAASFGDTALLGQLGRTLQFAAFPTGEGGYAASNQVGDAVLFYALELGPAWERLR